MSGADLSVIIVSMNCRGELAECLASVECARGGLAVETFVVDNASRDGAAAMVAERFPQVRLVANKSNRGFAAANNQAVAMATGGTSCS